MTKEEDRTYVLNYKSEVKEQFRIAQQTQSQKDLDKAIKMYNKLIAMGSEYDEKYNEPINVII